MKSLEAFTYGLDQNHVVWILGLVPLDHIKDNLTIGFHFDESNTRSMSKIQTNLIAQISARCKAYMVVKSTYKLSLRIADNPTTSGMTCNM